MSEAKLPEGWKPPFRVCEVESLPRVCDSKDNVCVIDAGWNGSVVIVHALNTTYSSDGELAQAKRKIEALVEAGDSKMSGECYCDDKHKCSLCYAEEDWTAAKEMP